MTAPVALTAKRHPRRVQGGHRAATPEARLAVVCGAHPAVSNSDLLPLLAEAGRRWAALVVIDPRRTATAARLLGAVQPWTPERAGAVCGVPAADVEWLAEAWATTRPALLLPGWAFERNGNGDAAWRAVLALPLLVGPFDLRGDERGEGLEVRPAGGTVQSRGTFPSHARAPGRARLWDDDQPPPAADRFPLALLTPAAPKSIGSLLAEVHPGDGALRLRPADAAARRRAGDEVMAWDGLGRQVLRAAIDGSLRSGVATLAEGPWFGHGDGPATANLLVPGHVDGLAGGACSNDTRVEVARAGDG